LFPRPPLTQVRLPHLSTGVAGLEDPAHLDLIAMVIAKLWNIFGPCRSYFGEKDWQQLTMFQRLAEDLCSPVEVVACPTIRHHDGLAMSSRNAQLSPTERAAAPALYHGLSAARAAIVDGERDAVALSSHFTDTVRTAAVEYFTAVDAATMTPLEKLEGDARLLGSIRLGSVRLV